MDYTKCILKVPKHLVGLNQDITRNQKKAKLFERNHTGLFLLDSIRT